MAYAVNEATESRPSTVSTAIEGFDLPLDEAAQIADRLKKLLDRVRGPRPSDVVGKEQLEAPPHSLMTALNQRRSRLVAIVDGIRSATDGLESSL